MQKRTLSLDRRSFLLAFGGTVSLWIVPIPGTTKLHRLQENLGGAEVELTPEDLQTIHEAISAIEVQGDRYPAHYQNLVNR